MPAKQPRKPKDATKEELKSTARSLSNISERENKNWLNNKDRMMWLLQKWIERKQICN